jgi:hypothetical protein
MSDAATMHADLPKPPHGIDKSGSLSSCIADRAHFRALDSARQEERTFSKGIAGPSLPSDSGRLGFAHSVTPHISKLGRQLAARYAVNFESVRLREPSQDLEELCSPRYGESSEMEKP